MKAVHVSLLQYSMRPCDYGERHKIEYPTEFYLYTTDKGREFLLFPPAPSKLDDYLPDGRFMRGDLYTGYLWEVADRVWNQFTPMRFAIGNHPVLGLFPETP